MRVLGTAASSFPVPALILSPLRLDCAGCKAKDAPSDAPNFLYSGIRQDGMVLKKLVFPDGH